VSTQFDINFGYQIAELHMTIQLNKFADIHNSPGQPFGASLALKNFFPITAFTQKVCKTQEIKAPVM